MKKILLSIKPEHVVDILNRKKTIEIRKYIPKCELPIEVLIYCCKPKRFWHVGCMGFFNDDLWYHPVKKTYICDDSCELMCLPEGYTYTENNFLNGKVVAKFTLNKAETIKLPYTKFGCSEWVGCEEARTLQTQSMNEETLLEKSCLEKNEIYGYLNFKNSPDNVGYAWHIDNLVIFGKPKELSDYGIKRSPQSYCYLKGE